MDASRPSILADVVEALIGAVYLESGLEVARWFVLELLQKYLARISGGDVNPDDFKTKLQEVAQEVWRKTPHYRVVKETGHAHERRFTVQVSFDEEMIGEGTGRSKKEAEQAAAADALDDHRPRPRALRTRPRTPTFERSKAINQGCDDSLGAKVRVATSPFSNDGRALDRSHRIAHRAHGRKAANARPGPPRKRPESVSPPPRDSPLARARPARCDGPSQAPADGSGEAAGRRPGTRLPLTYAKEQRPRTTPRNSERQKSNARQGPASPNRERGAVFAGVGLPRLVGDDRPRLAELRRVEEKELGIGWQGARVQAAP